jgi:hypothetical protein
MIEENYPPTYARDDVPDESAAQINRINRDYLLEQSDWTQLSDINQQTRYAYVGYRQALRDLPQHKNWPKLAVDDWPVKPE